MMLVVYALLCVTGPDFPKIIFCSKNGKEGQKMGQTQGSLDFLENLVINIL